MPSPQVVVFLMGVADLALAGLISNTFLVTMMVTEWTENKRLGSIGQLLLSVGLSNLGSNVSVAVNLILAFYAPHLVNTLWFQIVSPFTNSVVYFRFWLAAWLCVFYCIKIVNNTYSFIHWGKQRISWLIPRLLAGTWLVSILSCFSIFSVPRHTAQNNRTGIVTNETQTEDFRFQRIWYLIIGCGFPFVVALLCSILSIASLGTHLRRMT
ncbi:hypothetical protein JRQ81_010874, partial [Phrynocephalus forsythii]